MDGTAEDNSTQKTNETRSENNCVDSQLVSTDCPTNQPHTTQDKISKRKRKRNRHKQKEDGGSRDDSLQPNGMIACSSQVEAASGTEMTAVEERQAANRQTEDEQREGHGDIREDGTKEDRVELLKQLEELEKLDGETIQEYVECLDTGSEAEMSYKKRNEMYEKGEKLLKLGKNETALKCFLQCLKGLEQHNTFVFLPQCLRSVADIYYKQEEYEKAVQFIQAEKMFYETSLIETSTQQKLLEDRKKERDGGGEEQPSDANASHPDILKADEFENLARMCLQQNQSQLALEYQGKATKLRKKVYGDNHLVTTKSLDFFTVVYGEVGKQQYSESMERITRVNAGGDSEPANEMTVEDTLTPVTQRRGPSAQQGVVDNYILGEAEVVQQANFSDLVEDAREHEEWLSRLVLWILFLLCITCLSVIMFYLYCKVDVTSRSCNAWKADMNYHWMHLKYLYYSYMSAAKNKFTSTG